MEVAACIASDAMYEASLFSAEWDAVTKGRAARRADFAAGRASAREALGALGAPMIAMPVGQGGAPVWPDGFVGSITHTDAFCATVAARAHHAISLGLDAESAEPLAPGLEGRVCGPGDYPPSKSRVTCADVAWPKLVFSIKEAFYKCQYPLTRRFLDFRAATVSFAPAQTSHGGRFKVSSGRQPGETAPWPRCSGSWRIFDGLIIAGVWVDGARPARLARG